MKERERRFCIIFLSNLSQLVYCCWFKIEEKMNLIPFKHIDHKTGLSNFLRILFSSRFFHSHGPHSFQNLGHSCEQTFQECGKYFENFKGDKYFTSLPISSLSLSIPLSLSLCPCSSSFLVRGKRGVKECKDPFDLWPESSRDSFQVPVTVVHSQLDLLGCKRVEHLIMEWVMSSLS